MVDGDKKNFKLIIFLQKLVSKIKSILFREKSNPLVVDVCLFCDSNQNYCMLATKKKLKLMLVVNQDDFASYINGKTICIMGNQSFSVEISPTDPKRQLKFIGSCEVRFNHQDVVVEKTPIQGQSMTRFKVYMKRTIALEKENYLGLKMQLLVRFQFQTSPGGDPLIEWQPYSVPVRLYPIW